MTWTRLGKSVRLFGGASTLVGAAGALVLVCHGIVPTYQPAQFRRVYADRIPPDRFDLVGTALSIGGAAIMVLAPLAPGGQWREHASRTRWCLRGMQGGSQRRALSLDRIDVTVELDFGMRLARSATRVVDPE